MDLIVLSYAQQNLLDNAADKLKHDKRNAWTGRDTAAGWFSCQFTQRGSIDFASRPQTAKSLCGLGLMEYRVVGQPYRDRGKWRHAKEYRISQEGLKFVLPNLR